MDEPTPAPAPGRAILMAELLAIGTELTVGETTDTNSGELARSREIGLDAASQRFKLGRIQSAANNDSAVTNEVVDRGFGEGLRMEHGKR